jgi:transcriptional regulator with XRE-family HTH domain
MPVWQYFAGGFSMGSFKGKVNLLMTYKVMTPKKLAETTGIKPRTIASWIGDGKNSEPLLGGAFRIAEALDVSLNVLADDRLDDAVVLSPRIIQTERGRDLSPPKKRAQ